MSRVCSNCPYLLGFLDDRRNADDFESLEASYVAVDPIEKVTVQKAAAQPLLDPA